MCHHPDSEYEDAEAGFHNRDATLNDDDVWAAAYGIAWVGACNKVAVQEILNRYTALFGADHTAVRAIAGHLAFLEGTALGPSFEELDAVVENAKRLGIHSD